MWKNHKEQENEKQLAKGIKWNDRTFSSTAEAGGWQRVHGVHGLIGAHEREDIVENQIKFVV